MSGFTLCHNILISSRGATISWWDRRFRLSPPVIAGVWLRLSSPVGQVPDLPYGLLRPVRSASNIRFPDLHLP
jgi:hypothetical protein